MEQGRQGDPLLRVFRADLGRRGLRAGGDSLDIGAPKLLFKISVPPKPNGAEIFPTSDHQRFLVVDHGLKPNALLNLVVNRNAPSR